MDWFNLLVYLCILSIHPSSHSDTIKGPSSRPTLLRSSFLRYRPTEEQAEVAEESTAIKRNVESDRWIGWDKFWHFSASFVTLGAGYHLCANRLEFKENIAKGISIGGTFTLGIGKEILDRYGFRRQFSWKDIAFNLLGITLGYFVFVY